MAGRLRRTWPNFSANASKSRGPTATDSADDPTASSWPLTGRHATRPPLLQPDPELRESDVVVDYQDALASGDVEAIVAVFEPGGYAREPAGGRYINRGQDGLRAFCEQLFSNGGGIPLEPWAVIDDARVGA